MPSWYIKFLGGRNKLEDKHSRRSSSLTPEITEKCNFVALNSLYAITNAVWIFKYQRKGFESPDENL